ncbi:winged helix-turn-helix domain-containing protein [Nonomuraea sp. SBT364]|uniref:winged helix-turn-helix domain-containing protein n=1 Tax=Nonomuraea sp. SBT364 TaxID=1580530 RepID=UPI00066C3FED|nr:helix-turn-helix domain-containing protein [Nonomuraea sp. SBT364]
MEEEFKISDPQVLKVVAHPLRVRLLGLLRADGPATASGLGRVVGESSGSTSYHLRELAKYGFIEEDPDQRDGRERRWRSRHRYTTWDNLEMSGSPEGREAVKIMRMRQVAVLGRQVQEFDEGEWGDEWVRAAGLSDTLVRLPASALLELSRQVGELLEEFGARHADAPDAEQVLVWMGGFPRRTGEEEA